MGFHKGELIGVDFGRQPGHGPPIVEKRPCTHHFYHLLPLNILVCPPNTFDKSTPVRGFFGFYEGGFVIVRSDVVVFGGFSDSTGESILDSLEALYLSDVCVQEKRVAVVYFS